MTDVELVAEVMEAETCTLCDNPASDDPEQEGMCADCGVCPCGNSRTEREWDDTGGTCWACYDKSVSHR